LRFDGAWHRAFLTILTGRNLLKIRQRTATGAIGDGFR